MKLSFQLNECSTIIIVEYIFNCQEKNNTALIIKIKAVIFYTVNVYVSPFSVSNSSIPFCDETPLTENSPFA